MCVEEDCSACSMAHWSDDPDNKFPTCTDFNRFKYSNVCRPRQDSSLCGADDLCFNSYPHNDPLKWKSPDRACRPLPRRLVDDEFKFAKRECNMRKGLCAFGCEGTCHNSWPIDDPERWKSSDAMCRCKI